MKEEAGKTEENSNPLYGKPWKNEFTAPTFEEADEKRNNILKSGKVQVKVKRRSHGFVVKTRDINVAKPASKKKKSAKNKNKE